MIIDHEWRRIMAAVVVARAWLRVRHVGVALNCAMTSVASALPCNCRDRCGTRVAMSDAQGSTQAVLLKAWMADVRRTAARSEHEIAQCPAPPARLMRGDCAAAGFKILGPMSACYHSDVFFQVNFSAGFAHQAMFIERRRRWGRAGWRDVLLWIDGKPVSVPVDLNGRPQSANLSRWLNHRFAADFPTAEGSPLRALSLWNWQSEVARIAHERRSFTRDFPAPPRLLTREDCSAIGFEFHDERSAWNFLDGTANSMVHVDFSPDLRHAAVTIKGADWCGALLWVDGEPVPVPRTQDGEPVCEEYPTWLDNRFVCAQVGGLWDHPLLDPSKIDLLGNIRGLLVWDAVKQMLYVERPESAQAWTSPLVDAQDGSLRIYANGEAVRQGRHDRVLLIPD
jgi:hypothetical protein